MNTLELIITGITCEACIKLIKKRIEKIDGVKDIDIKISGETVISGERNIDLEEIVDVLKDTDYKVI
ncbi:MAG: Heavy metal translocating P-type ATPase [Candidatus Gottesmanbacteria bacterium GW2011_GWC2_39_8]|uniref:Heavy metal translocating P-type ATPase n=1 Tax=Candidatus Gottesmanbacteria bacterium GW2011_GWC2_39_8 TaxID=1618450 RepID=A0A0G0PZG9_9BACT|nr:MAG: Heavy metal translocating P-type ATPase [Candidatus Gottesmanbacteria bacterium GW2011_GWC2_39_8]